MRYTCPWNSKPLSPWPDREAEPRACGLFPEQLCPFTMLFLCRYFLPMGKIIKCLKNIWQNLGLAAPGSIDAINCVWTEPPFTLESGAWMYLGRPAHATPGPQKAAEFSVCFTLSAWSAFWKPDHLRLNKTWVLGNFNGLISLEMEDAPASQAHRNKSHLDKSCLFAHLSSNFTPYSSSSLTTVSRRCGLHGSFPQDKHSFFVSLAILQKDSTTLHFAFSQPQPQH